ncbi:hypothetical protein L6164_015264 [Bauhinia variegata]|uniref:Uncharacterized protein n=1 Tax=Bauhinia variegata TaxID=167791 RepID=A0ACB9NM03_BAUVA|nr:hypothetical protein L6164_015264 [Bauhinia variegata]
MVAPLLISLLVLQLARSDTKVIKTVVEDSVPSPSPGPLPPNIDCDGACEGRCQLSSRPRLCKRACGTCCERCHCVPSGTSGHYDECPCYANMTTHGGRRKCP